MMPVSSAEMATQKGAKSAKVISRAERNWDIGFKAVELVGCGFYNLLLIFSGSWCGNLGSGEVWC